MLTPLNIAFSGVEDGNSATSIIIMIIDCFFVIDIFVIFNSAFYDEETELIEDRKKIAKNYLNGWFTIDLLAIVPFDVILDATDFN